MAAKFVEGTLDVTLKSASDLREDMSVKLDAYCVVSCASTAHRSNTVTDAGKTMNWEQTFHFDKVASTSVLKLESSMRRTPSDRSSCACKIPLTRACTSGSDEVCVPVLDKKGKPIGETHVSMTFKATSMADGPTKGNWILPTYANKDCWKDYEQGKVVGKGSFGTTYLVTKKDTQEQYAVKVISKRKLTTMEEVEDIQREVRIMHHLAGHPNVVQLKNVYEDKSYVYLVMDACMGGELFDAIVERGTYSEKDARALMRTIVSVVAHCHDMGVIHRDLKPENFLLLDKSANPVLKSIDFGLSSFYQEGQVFHDIVGSPFYVAPEVVRRSYGKEADIWSCGVILYILLCGYPPFHGDNETKIFEAIMNKSLDFQSDPWPKVSEPAKECIRRMLDRNPKTRASAQQTLEHEWMRENGVATEKRLEMEVLTSMKKFSAGNRLKKEAAKIIAANLPTDEICGLREMFIAIDVDHSGSITAEEFANALRMKGNSLPEDEVQRLVSNADVDGDGTCDYEEFLAATINQSKLEREDRLKIAFEHFDLDHDGSITHDELMQSLANLGINDAGIKEIIADVDRDGNGQIDYNEFCLMMRNL
uniref:Calcium-stimulated protein kinase n=1 Tax=Chlamydomonas moewusii TaxID=3054 RepID=Q39485_CHLMO|nr:calcium-stimulated protein kinase [Chlamydomonas moewusii]